MKLAAVRVEVPEGPASAYEVRVERGSLAALGDRCREHAPAHAHAVISDSHVAELYASRALESLEAAGCVAHLFTFPAGEWNKTRESWRDLSDGMLRAGLGRDSTVVALGGGVTGDLAGFVAATFLRGVPVVQVPTSLLAMLDAAIGGKTGVDASGVKNSVGAFHHPAHVLIDPDVLQTLSGHQRTAGLAEGVKMATIADADLFATLERDAASLAAGEIEVVTPLIHRCAALKAEVVGEDPREIGRRAILNFGHTVGHALESISGFALLHGEAVAAGMRVEAELGELLGVTEAETGRRLAELLAALGMPDVLADDAPDVEALLEAAAADKKGRAGRPRYALPAALGRMARTEDGGWTRTLPEGRDGELLEAALRRAAEGTDSGA